MGTEEFDFEAARRGFPEHWEDDGRPATNSTWRSRPYPQMRVRVSGRDPDGDVSAIVYWDGDLEGLARLFTYEGTERWNIGADGLVCGSAGIDRGDAGEWHFRWRDETATLVVTFDRAMFGGPDTWHIGREGVNLPFFEPVPDWIRDGA